MTFLAAVLSAGAVLLLVRPDAGARLRRCRPGRDASTWHPRPEPPAVTGGRRPGRRGRAGRSPGGVARPAPVPVPVVVELVAAVVAAGAPPSAAVRIVSRCLVEAGDPGGLQLAEVLRGQPDQRSGRSERSGRSGWASLTRTLQLADATGLGPVGLLREAAAQQRRWRAQARAVAARRLAVHVLAPTTLCLLPAFVVTTVVPLVLDLLWQR